MHNQICALPLPGFSVYRTRYVKQKFSWKDWHQQTGAVKYEEKFFFITDAKKVKEND